MKVLAVSVGEAREQVAAFLKDKPIEGAAVLADVKGEVFHSFRMRGHPSLVAVDSKGNRRWAGYSMDEALKRWESLGRSVERFVQEGSVHGK